MSKVLIGIDKSKSFRVYLTVTTDMVETARKIHMTTPLATAGMGRVLTAAGIMGVMLKNKEDKLTLIIKGDGPAKQILATADGDGNVKGYIANPDVDLPLTKEGKLDVGGSIGIGDLTVIKDLGLKEPYMGTIALVNGEIAEDLTAYFFISEQQNTSVALGVKIERDYKVGAAGGMIIQMLPGAEEGSVDALEEMIGKMPPLTTLIDGVSKRCAGKSEDGIVLELMNEIFGEMPEEYKVEPLESREIRWNCDCSEKRLEKALMSIGKTDLTEILEEDGEAELQCQFCLKKYHFDKPHLERILEEMS
ncbi:Hsp33 family molecular chaperone HslO [Zhenpiania hominis]|uniref:33 kDa chaperonin n=1 Tax=Zhenpiania hominis TaxID=2763644 RepID=A0A923SR19_9FIRM|nr:Hsp33 family molecular chaperone HslO [Zhenpiania hominis]MBC6680110.1 Hsp33 family molecular chaperone HslO [Zhenpiania hominis]